MRILIVNKFLYPNGGSETYIFKIGQCLQKMGHEVQYFGMEHEGRIVSNAIGSYTSDMSFHGGSKLSKLMYPVKILYSFEAKKKIRAVLDDFKPDVVHLNNINFQITPSIIDEIEAYNKDVDAAEKREDDKKNSDRSRAVATGGHIRIVYTAHDYQWVCPNHMLYIPSTGEMCSKCIDGDYSYCAHNKCIHSSKLRSLLGTLEAKLYDRKKTYALVDTVIAPSFFMKEKLSHNRSIDDNKIVALHNFVDENSQRAKQTSTSEDNPDIMRTGFDRNVGDCGKEVIDKPYVLYFGRYDSQKGIKTLLKACRNLPDIQFVFAGKGELEKEVDSTPNVLNKGFLTGQELTDTITKAAFTVFPSEWYENCPFSVVESQMNGTPIIVSNLGGTTELIKENVTGEVFTAGDESQLTEKIRKLWENPKLVSSYRDNCKRIFADGEGKTDETGSSDLSFDNLQSYCEKLLRIYSGETCPLK